MFGHIMVSLILYSVLLVVTFPGEKRKVQCLRLGSVPLWKELKIMISNKSDENSKYLHYYLKYEQNTHRRTRVIIRHSKDTHRYQIKSYIK